MTNLTFNNNSSMDEKSIPIFKTPCQTEREERDLAVYNDYQEMTSVEGQSKTVVTEFLMNKYGIHSAGTIYVIRQRVEKRLREQEKKGGAK